MSITSAVLVAQAKSRINNLSPENALNSVQTGKSIMVDLREKEELDAMGTIPRAIHIPRGMLEFAVDPGHPSYHPAITADTSLILASASGARSSLATETLHSLGFEDVSNLDGGFKAWVEQGLPFDPPINQGPKGEK